MTADTVVTRDAAALAAFERGVALGLLSAAEAILANANPPRDTGRMAESGHAVAFLNGAQVGGPNVPGYASQAGPGPAAFVGFGFPARFVETGTVKMAPRPFLGPAGMGVEPRVPALVKERAP